ncbi:RHS repeat-associated core domain-containing protein [Maricaulis sp.]|uniref:RHS repeat-associated core domain-containing protein n=1 Tax=Maricaulis sp. TaxID=1486257 RepID=UPI002B279324|nr:RHS repeat-associated core domain-containing protein [Maricaulis sp.]
MSPFVRAGRRTAIIWHDNFTARYVYNDAGQLIRVEEDDDGNGTSERTLSEYVYDRMGRLIERHVGGQDPHGAQAGPGGNAASGIAYTYEADGEVVQMHHLFSDQSVTFTYAYDGAGYLEAEHANAPGWLWSAGGQTQSRDFSSTDSVRAGEPTNVQNQYGAVVHVEGSTTTNYTLSYDFSDNLSGDGTRSFLHDTRNRLTGLVQSGQTIQYRYDVIGRRTGVSLNNGASWTRYSHAGGMETGELNDAGQYLQRYIPGPGIDQREAMITVNPSTGVATARHYYHANRLGSVIALADASGALSDRYVYTPYGVEAPLNTSGNPFRYTGRRYDPESELYYYRARYYWPEIGRFLETDPIGYADQMNLYACVANNPLNATDPTGMRQCETCTASLQRDGLNPEQIRTVQDMHGRAAGEAAGEQLKEAMWRPGEDDLGFTFTVTMSSSSSAASGNVGISESIGDATEITLSKTAPFVFITGREFLNESSRNGNPFDPTEELSAVGADLDFTGLEIGLGTIEQQTGGALMMEIDAVLPGGSMGIPDQGGFGAPGTSLGVDWGWGFQMGGFHTNTEIVGGREEE